MNVATPTPQPAPAPRAPDPILTDRFADAFAFAHGAHATQTRKGTRIPYLAHLMAVAALVLEHGGDQMMAIAALLHDAPEDQGGRPTLEAIRTRFGDRVAAIVEGCTDTFDDPKPPYLERKRAYLEHLKEADFATCVVAAADKLHNARAILADFRVDGEELWQRFNAEPATLHWFYREAGEVLGERLADHPAAAMAEALKATVVAIWGEGVSG